MQIVIGIVIVIVGLFFVIKTNAIFSAFGSVGFFEKYLGVGNSKLGYKLVGVFLIFIGMLFITGLIDGFLNFILGPLIRSQSV